MSSRALITGPQATVNICGANYGDAAGSELNTALVGQFQDERGNPLILPSPPGGRKRRQGRRIARGQLSRQVSGECAITDEPLAP
jgi:hypothetical protein